MRFFSLSFQIRLDLGATLNHSNSKWAPPRAWLYVGCAGLFNLGDSLVAFANFCQAQGTAQSCDAQLAVGILALCCYAVQRPCQITFTRGQSAGQDPENPWSFNAPVSWWLFSCVIMQTLSAASPQDVLQTKSGEAGTSLTIQVSRVSNALSRALDS